MKTLGRDGEHMNVYTDEEKKSNPREQARNDALKLLKSLNKQKEQVDLKAKQVRTETKNETAKLLDKLNSQAKATVPAKKEESHRKVTLLKKRK